MTEIESGTLPATDAVALETENVANATDVESSPTPTTTPDDSGQGTEADRDERGRFTGAQRRIDELTRNWREAERREAALLAALQQREQPPPREPEPPQALPTLESVGYDEARYQAALLQHATQLARAEVRKELDADRQQSAERARQSTHEARISAFATKVPGFAEKINDPYLPVNPPLPK